MKDIILTKTSSFIEEAELPTPQVIQHIRTQSPLQIKVERLFHSIGTFADGLYRIVNKSELNDTFRVVVRTNEPVKSRRKALSTTAKHIGKKAGKKVQQLHHSVKTPLGKLALVQAMAILALFSYVTLKEPAQFKTEPKSVGETVQNSNLQRYLPVVGQYVEPKAFETTTITPASGTTGPKLYTWVTPWNIDATKENIAKYATISAFWLSINEDGAGVTPKVDWQAWHTFTKTTPKQPGQTYYLTISGDPNHTYKALSNPDVQAAHIKNLLSVVTDQGFDGIDIDYEGLGESNRAAFTEFIRNLTAVFHAHNKQVAVTVEARLNNQVPMDWHALSEITDELRLMVYDYHGRITGTPGPITPIGWLKEVLDFAQQTTTINKVVVGLGNYGYDWVAKTEDDQTTWQGTGISFEQALAIATEHKLQVIRATGIDERGYDIGSIPTFTYKDSADSSHAVWFEDSTSLQAKTTLINQYSVKGIIFWSVGLGDLAFWQSVTTNR